MNRRTYASGHPAGGSTLIEVLMSVLLLALLAVAGGAHLYHARAMVAIQRNRMIATELTAGRMERIQTSRPAAIAPPGPGVYYLMPSNGTWVVTAADPGESIVLNHHTYPIQSTVEWEDLNPGVATNSYLRVTVTTAYRPETGDTVSLTTFYTP